MAVGLGDVSQLLLVGVTGNYPKRMITELASASKPFTAFYQSDDRIVGSRLLFYLMAVPTNWFRATEHVGSAPMADSPLAMLLNIRSAITLGAS